MKDFNPHKPKLWWRIPWPVVFAACVLLAIVFLVSGCGMAVPLQVGDPYGTKAAAPAAYPTPCPKDSEGNYRCTNETVHEVPVVGLDPTKPEGDTLPTMGRATVLQQPRQ